MLRSMTAYGRGESKINEKMVVVELRSLNHRFRDFSIKLPKNYDRFEGDVKELLSKRFARGRIEFSVQKEVSNRSDSNFQLNTDLLRKYYRLAEEIKEEFNLEEKVSINMLMNLDGVITYQEENNKEEEREGVMVALKASMDSLEKMREIEGENIRLAFQKNLENLFFHINKIEKRAPQVITLYQETLTKRIKDFVGTNEIDESRIAQEIAHFAERCDITEEITRLKSHIDQYKMMLQVTEPVGRKLEFILQEMNREVNTIGSKSNHAGISQEVIEMKSELEKMREQAQNVE